MSLFQCEEETFNAACSINGEKMPYDVDCQRIYLAQSIKSLTFLLIFYILVFILYINLISLQVHFAYRLTLPIFYLVRPQYFAICVFSSVYIFSGFFLIRHQEAMAIDQTSRMLCIISDAFSVDSGCSHVSLQCEDQITI